MVEELSPSRLAECIRDGEAWQILDVREPWELGIVTLEGSIPIPMGEIVARHEELDPRRPVAVLCHSGMRSYRIAVFLASRGYARVANVSGGIDAWAAELDPTLPRY